MADPDAWLFPAHTDLPITTMTEVLEQVKQIRQRGPEDEEDSRKDACKTPTKRRDPYSGSGKRNDLA